jgi:hypothetical protein
MSTGHPFRFSVPDRNRTYDLQLRRLSLYPTELLGHDYKIILQRLIIKLNAEKGQDIETTNKKSTLLLENGLA